MVKIRCFGVDFELYNEDRIMFDGFSHRIVTRYGSPKIPKPLAKKLIKEGKIKLSYTDRKGREIYVIGGKNND